MGRNGMHQYNNMDTAMISALNAIKSIDYATIDLPKPKSKTKVYTKSSQILN
jgi:hypothetical protein